MGQTRVLIKALRKNSNDPQQVWRIFKRALLSDPVSATSILSSPSFLDMCLSPRSFIPAIARVLIRADRLPEIDTLHHHLLHFSKVSAEPLFSLIILLAKSGLIDKAVSQFRSFRDLFPETQPPIYLYNVVIEGSIRENRAETIPWLYKDMTSSGVSPQTYTFNLLIRGLSDSGRLDEARKVLEKMPDKGCSPNEFSFGILIRAYCRAGLAMQGMEILDSMKSFLLVPNKVVYNTLISWFCKERKTDQAEALVERMREDGLVPDVVTFNSRIVALCNDGKMLEASRIFRDMQTDKDLGLPRPNTITNNLMLDGFFKAGMLDEAATLVKTMKKNGDFSDLRTFNIWLAGLVNNGKLLEAQAVLKEMLSLGTKPDIYSYNIVMDGLCKNGLVSDARSLIGLMKSAGIYPDTVTYSTLLQGYCRKGEAFFANNVLNEMVRAGCFPNTYICNILLHSLCKRGKMLEAENLLQKMKERGYDLDTVTCNILIDGLCKAGKLDKAIEIANGMWSHGRAALGEMGNLYIDLVDESNDVKKCMPDLITYSIIIKALCVAGRLDDAKKKFLEMVEKNLAPDSMIYNTFIHSYCKAGKVSSAFRVLKDMEQVGCSRSLQTYNSLIMGLASKKQIFEIYGLLDEMKERGIAPNVCTYNYILGCLCESGQTNDAMTLLNEMLQNEISPNIYSFRILVEAFCGEGEFIAAREVFEISIEVCGHQEALYSAMFNELLLRGEVFEAECLFQAAVERCLDIGNFKYHDLIDMLCKDEKLENATHILLKLISKRYSFEPASFMPVVDGLAKCGKKHEADELSEKMLEMASEGGVTNKIVHEKKGPNHGTNSKPSENGWKNIIHRDDGSGIALRTLKRVQKGWGQGSILDQQPPKKDLLDYWESSL